MIAEVDTRRNGTTAPAMPIKTVDIALDVIGYPGWVVTMRTNPRASVYDDFLALDKEGGIDNVRWWSAFQHTVIAWNFADEHGHPLPLPRDLASEKDADLPYGVLGFIYGRYLEAFRAATEIPKVPDAPSEPTSSTSTRVPNGE